MMAHDGRPLTWGRKQSFSGKDVVVGLLPPQVHHHLYAPAQ
jgi:hypothetical protein